MQDSPLVLDVFQKMTEKLNNIKSGFKFSICISIRSFSVRDA